MTEIATYLGHNYISTSVIAVLAFLSPLNL